MTDRKLPVIQGDYCYQIKAACPEQRGADTVLIGRLQHRVKQLRNALAWIWTDTTPEAPPREYWRHQKGSRYQMTDRKLPVISELPPLRNGAEYRRAEYTDKTQRYVSWSVDSASPYEYSAHYLPHNQTVQANHAPLDVVLAMLAANRLTPPPPTCATCRFYYVLRGIAECRAHAGHAGGVHGVPNDGSGYCHLHSDLQRSEGGNET